MSDRADHRAGARPGLKAQTADAPVAPTSARGSALQSANLFDLIRERAGAPNQLALETSDENRTTRAVGTHLAVQAAIAIDDHHINHSVLGANQAIPQHEQTRRLRRNPPTEDDVRNAIERATVSAKRIEIVLSESIVAEGQDRVLSLPWTRTSSRRRREIIQRVGEVQRPLRAMRTKARDGFIKALRDAHRWLDELLVDPTQTVESLAIREGKSERSIRMTLSLAFVSPGLAEAAMEGRLPRGFCIKRLTDLPMLWSEQWGAIGLQARAQVRAELR